VQAVAKKSSPLKKILVLLLCASPYWITVGCLHPIELEDWEDNNSETEGESYKTRKGPENEENEERPEYEIKSYYGTLCLPYGANFEAIKKAYKRLSLKYHPDKTPNDEAKEAKTEKFKELNAAYEELGKLKQAGRLPAAS